MEGSEEQHVCCDCVCVCHRKVDLCACFALVLVETRTVRRGDKQSEMSPMHFLTHYHVNALCFQSTGLCQTRGPSVLSARAGAPHGPGLDLVQFFAGTIHREFSSADTAAGLILVHSICTGISAASEESVSRNQPERFRNTA